MQFKLFTIPVFDNGSDVEEMNRFLRANRIVEVENELVTNKNGAYWCFCIRYIEKNLNEPVARKNKVDYKHLLDEATFEKFSKLRTIRKKVAADEGIPAYVVFTDEELAGLAKLDTITPQNMLSVKGIGDKKVEKFAKYFITKDQSNETTRTPH